MPTQRELFLNHLAQTSDFPLLLEIVNAEGVRLFDINGKSYIDLISGIGVSNVGHCHPDVVKAIHEQVDKYMHLMVYGEYVQTPQVQLATLIAENLPKNLSSVYFVNSGTEATEGAMKLAKRYTGRTEIISCKNAYHGSTQGSLSIMGSEAFKNSFRPLLPDTNTINYNSFPDLSYITNRTAAVFIEVVQGEAGVVLPEEGYLIAVRKRCTEMGALMVIDEVQTGFGRTGKLFGFEHHQLVPDIITCAKGMGGGMPIGAFISSKEIMQCLTNNPILGHITTFGGHPVMCAASLATLKVILKEELYKDAEKKGQLIKSKLNHPAIKTIRQKGLMLAVEFDSFDTNKAIIDECMENGVITDWFLFNDKSMRIAPPLIISEEDILYACSVIMDAINKVCSSR